MKGKNWNPKIRERALASMRAGKSAVDVAREIHVPYKTVLTWRVRSGEFGDGRASANKAKPTKPTMTGYLNKQLAIIATMLREKLPELTNFSLTTTADGKAEVAYTVRQTVSGTVKL
jgi:transposase